MRVLHVHGTSEYLSASSREITKSIPLPSLKELDLEDTNDCILWLWSRLSIPFDATVSIRQVEYSSPPIRLDLGVRIDSLRPLVRHVRSLGACPISGFAFINSDSECILNYRLYTTDVGAASDNTSHPSSSLYRDSHLLLNIYIQDMEPDRLDALASISQISGMFGLMDVEKVELDCTVFFKCVAPDEQPVMDPASVFRQFRNVRSLCLTGYTYYFGVYSLIIEFIATPPESNEGLLICPKLQSLVLIDPMFSKHEEMDAFVAVIERRFAMGVPLQELKIWFCDEQAAGMSESEASRAFRTRLQSLVPAVEFHALK